VIEMARLLTEAVVDETVPGGYRIKLDVGKVLGGVIAGIALVAIAAYLYVQNQATPGAAVFEAGQAILFGVLGIAAGEKSVGKTD
jgi:hypothetical protein